ncbi:MAG: LPS export ABC transporter periplasmic protein LptC [Candidatus Tantalella remota]|nr:LPS export ABC transporter periplasmic protein LptC [Candidatus Tantalella remota]
MKKKIIWIVIIVLVAAGIWFYRCRNNEKKASSNVAAFAKDSKSTGLEQKIFSFTIDGRSPTGANQWHLEGESAEIIGDDIHLNDLKAEVYGDDVKVDLKSDFGVYNKKKGEVELIGNVKVVADSGFELDTDRATWSQSTKEISTDAIVDIRAEGMVARGKGGMANSDERTAFLKEDVTVTIEPDTRVDCAGSLEVRYNDNIAIFMDDVKVKDKDGNLFADKLTVEFDPDTKKLAKVIAEGNVKVKRGKSYTISEKAVYTESTKSARLEGRPRIIIDPTELSKLESFGKEETPTE